MNLDQYRELTPNGWVFRFPNGWMPSVIRQANHPFRFEIYLGVALDASMVAEANGGYPDGTVHHLTSEQAEDFVLKLAELPRRTIDDINGS